MLVGLVDPLQPADDVAFVGAAEVVGDLDADDQGVGRHADVLPGRVVAVAGDDARHMGAMAHVVQRIGCQRVGVERDQPVAGVGRDVGAVLDQVVVRPDAAVDDCYLDAGSVEVLAVPCQGRDAADGVVAVGQGGGGHRPFELDRGVDRDALDAAVVVQAVGDGCRDGRGEAVYVLELAVDPAAGGPDHILDRGGVALGGDDHLDRALVALRVGADGGADGLVPRLLERRAEEEDGGQEGHAHCQSATKSLILNRFSDIHPLYLHSVECPHLEVRGVM